MGTEHSWKERYTPYPDFIVGTMYFMGSKVSDYWCRREAARLFPSYERTWSRGHAGPPYLEGGPFANYLWRDQFATVNHSGSWKAYKYQSYRYEGGFICDWTRLKLGPLLSVDPPAMGVSSCTDHGDPEPYGPSAWDQYKPGKAVADLALVLAEIREVPRMLQTSARGFHELWKDAKRAITNKRKLADHWLNTQFGWLPFLSDMRKFYSAYNNCERLYRQVKASNNRWVKRGGSVTDVVSTDVVRSSATVTGHYPILNSYFYATTSNTGSYQILRLYKEIAWFEARFRYYIPNVDTVKWKRRYLRLLFGGSINPSLVWELTPWSWLVDWFSTVGDSISNVDNGWAENLAAKYAYVMDTAESSFLVDSIHRVNNGVQTANWEFNLKTKRRAAASPFGFGLSSGDLSARQVSILGALGISHRLLD